jgi:hypothetical protein
MFRFFDSLSIGGNYKEYEQHGGIGTQSDIYPESEICHSGRLLSCHQHTISAACQFKSIIFFSRVSVKTQRARRFHVRSEPQKIRGRAAGVN